MQRFQTVVGATYSCFPFLQIPPPDHCLGPQSSAGICGIQLLLSSPSCLPASGLLGCSASPHDAISQQHVWYVCCVFYFAPTGPASPVEPWLIQPPLDILLGPLYWLHHKAVPRVVPKSIACMEECPASCGTLSTFGPHNLKDPFKESPWVSCTHGGTTLHS